MKHLKIKIKNTNSYQFLQESNKCNFPKHISEGTSLSKKYHLKYGFVVKYGKIRFLYKSSSIKIHVNFLMYKNIYRNVPSR